MSNSCNAMLNAARNQLGYAEKRGDWTEFGDWYAKKFKAGSGFATAAWCDTFITWCVYQFDNENAVVGGKNYAYTPYHASWFAARGQWGTKPRIGAIVFFDWGGSRRLSAIDHVGIVEAVHADGSITTIEGNTADAVRRRRTAIAGYGYPAYSGGKPPSKPTPPKPGRAPAWPGTYLQTGSRGLRSRPGRPRCGGAAGGWPLTGSTDRSPGRCALRSRRTRG